MCEFAKGCHDGIQSIEIIIVYKRHLFTKDIYFLAPNVIVSGHNHGVFERVLWSVCKRDRLIESADLQKVLKNQYQN